MQQQLLRLNKHHTNATVQSSLSSPVDWSHSNGWVERDWLQKWKWNGGTTYIHTSGKWADQDHQAEHQLHFHEHGCHNLVVLLLFDLLPTVHLLRKMKIEAWLPNSLPRRISVQSSTLVHYSEKWQQNYNWKLKLFLLKFSLVSTKTF